MYLSTPMQDLILGCRMPAHYAAHIHDASRPGKNRVL